MTLGHGPKIVTDGLVFAYDMGPNPGVNKSWKGKPVTNSYSNIFTSQSMRTHTKHFWNGKTWVVNETYSDPGVQGPKGVYLGKVAKHTSGALNSSWSGNSYGYMLRDIASTAGTTSTMSVWTYMSDDCNLDSFPCTTEGATTNNIAVSGYSAGYNFSAKGTWQRLARSAVSDGNVRWIPVYPAKYGVTDGSFTGFFMWGGVQVEDNNFVSPLIPADDGVATRSNTQALLDWTGNNTITMNSSIVYNNDGTFSLDGTNFNSYASIPSQNLNNCDYTVEAWFNPSAVNRTQGIIGDAQYNWWRFNVTSGNNINVGHKQSDALGGPNITGTVTITANTWWHAVMTFNTVSGMKLYVNGILDTSTTNIQPFTITNRGPQYIGHYRGGAPSSANVFQGKIGSIKIYKNKELTAAEVAQNFQAHRGRYGI